MPVQEHLTDRDVLIEVVGMAIHDPEMSSSDLLERLEQLGRGDVVEEARAMQEILEDEGEDDVDDGFDVEEPS